jgi:hypothetical protein
MHPLFVLYAPPVYTTEWGAYPSVYKMCLGMDSTAFTLVLPATKSLLQKDTKGFST